MASVVPRPGSTGTSSIGGAGAGGSGGYGEVDGAGGMSVNGHQVQMDVVGSQTSGSYLGMGVGGVGVGMEGMYGGHSGYS